MNTMKFCWFLFLLTIALSARSQSIAGYSAGSDQKNNVELNVYGGYSTADFNWSIAGNSMGQNPNVLSEVKWKNIKGPGMGLDIRVNTWSPIFLKVNYQRNSIKSGKVSDTDYAADNRTEPGYQANLNSNEGFTYTYAVAGGYEFKINRVLKLSPFAGYLKNAQHLHLKDFDEETDPAIKALNSTYQASWTGPMLGVEAGFRLNNQFSLTGMLNYKQLKYKATADWNLIDAFAHPVSFRHTANGYGTDGLLQLNFRFNPLLSVFARGNYSYSNTGKGTDDLFLADGKTLQSQFNSATRHEAGLAAGIGLSL
ncbi:outer membrane beta-barrel protein [Pedobacter cryoconitis]|uniref:Outer membrane protein with beta-barrel domain n=1 Tax=Pedobacter cryoconitis TaxID=188932 RepID=A0A327SQ89_9SPHI|nr:outer membrane beta-barrel protein [Pedobacter cryoconitis]RAJ31078.1 outer membrane protein with beta-barrel domain [Pedobacter cryoconitis]